MLEREEGQREGVACEWDDGAGDGVVRREDGAGDGGKANAAVSDSGGGKGAGLGLSYTKLSNSG